MKSKQPDQFLMFGFCSIWFSDSFFVVVASDRKLVHCCSLWSYFVRRYRSESFNSPKCKIGFSCFEFVQIANDGDSNGEKYNKRNAIKIPLDGRMKQRVGVGGTLIIFPLK